MSGHRPWHTIRHKSRRCDSISPSSKTPCGLYWGHEGLHTSENRQVTWGYWGFSKYQEKTTFSSDVGDEHVERESQFPRPEMQEIGKSADLGGGYQPVTTDPPPFLSPPKPADSYETVTPPRYRRTPLVDKHDQELVERMLRHTKPIAFPKADEIEYQYPYQTEAVERIEEALAQIYKGSIPSRHLLTIEEAVDLLNGIIQTQVKKLREYEEMMAIDHERIISLQQQLASCNVDLHNSKQHELGLMCGDLQYKLNQIKKLVEENRNVGLAEFLAVDILEVLDS